MLSKKIVWSICRQQKLCLNTNSIIINGYPLSMYVNFSKNYYF